MIKIVRNKLVTTLKRVWISQCYNGWWNVWQFRPTLDGCYYKANRTEPNKNRGLTIDCEAGGLGSSLLRWFNKNIEDLDGNIVGGLPGPGEVWEVELYT